MSPDVDAAIAKAWPDRWSKANDPTRKNRSKARNNLRKAWAAYVQLKHLRKTNPSACCGTCENFSKMPLSDQMFCEANSDFYGYQIATADGLCTQWRQEA